MLLSTLDQKHPEYRGELWLDNWALYIGGETFRKRIKRFLLPNDLEGLETYADRCARAKYRSYIGTIVDYLTGAVFEQGANVSKVGDGEPDEFYTDFGSDCDGKGTDFSDFLRKRFVAALCAPRSFWICELPPKPDLGEDASLADFRAAGGDKVTVRAVDAERIYDWHHGTDGKLDWIVVHDRQCERPNFAFARSIVVETWTLYDRVNVTRWAISYEQHQRPADSVEVPVVDPPSPHGFPGCPVVALEFQQGLQLVDRLRDPQLSHFEADNALRHTLRMTAYAMPVFTGLPPNQEPGAIGAGRYLSLPALAKYGFMEPSGSAAKILSERIDQDRQEIYRLAHQMAQGVDNNAAAIGRSAESKSADADASNTMLDAWGAAIREAIKVTYDLLAAARGEDIEWNVEGFDSFETVDLTLLIEAAVQTDAIGIPSPIFKRELAKRMVKKLLPDLPSSTLGDIEKEIDKNITDEPDPLKAEMDAARNLAASGDPQSLGQPGVP